MQKENLFFFSFPNVSNFGIAKVTKKRAQNKELLIVFYAEIDHLCHLFCKDAKKTERKSKKQFKILP